MTLEGRRLKSGGSDGLWTWRRRRASTVPAQRAAFLVARLRGGVNRSAIAAMADGTRR
jgi:hypothetical protein